MIVNACCASCPAEMVMAAGDGGALVKLTCGGAWSAISYEPGGMFWNDAPNVDEPGAIGASGSVLMAPPEDMRTAHHPEPCRNTVALPATRAPNTPGPVQCRKDHSHHVPPPGLATTCCVAI